MNKLIRVGGTVYATGRQVVATFVHGAWYYATHRRGGDELQPCDPKDAATYDALPDAKTAKLSAGEESILRTAENILKLRYAFWKDEIRFVMTHVREGVMKGLTKYGPFEPGRDERNLVEWAMEEARDIVVYGSMYCADPKAKHREEMTEIVANAARLLVKMEGLR